ncbi:MAG: DUF4442 domain-containing protein, partial [Deltaproteobacteria bacterium]|nr:DUF4442 domain-containing protein [Deltaproteobacteria bacterium]
MDPRFWNIIERTQSLSPAAARRLVGASLRLASPFNAPLRAEIREWEPTLCRLRIPHRRALRNHLGGVHAGALATAGETPAGLLVLRSFPFSRYRLILKDLSVAYEKQARGDVLAEARIAPDTVTQAREGLERGEAQLIPVETTLSSPTGERLAMVRTTWQVKPWSQVRGVG